MMHVTSKWVTYRGVSYSILHFFCVKSVPAMSMASLLYPCYLGIIALWAEVCLARPHLFNYTYGTRRWEWDHSWLLLIMNIWPASRSGWTLASWSTQPTYSYSSNVTVQLRKRIYWWKPDNPREKIKLFFWLRWLKKKEGDKPTLFLIWDCIITIDPSCSVQIWFQLLDKCDIWTLLFNQI